jgi:uncharacterized protein YciI
MLFIVQFEDKPGIQELRKSLFQSHLEFLDSKKEQVLVPGALRDGERPLGGLWIVEAEDEEGVKEIFKGDPFWTNGLRASYRINRWIKAFPDRKVPI